MAELLDYLKRSVADEASDLFIIAGGPVCEKLEKRLCAISEDRLSPAQTEQLIMDIYKMATRSPDRYLERGDDDFSGAGPLPRQRLPPEGFHGGSGQDCCL